MDTVKLIEIIAKASQPSVNPAWVQAGIALLLVVVTGIYVWHTKGMVQAMKSQVDEMKKQNDIERKFKNNEMWDKALNEFFIPFKGNTAHCSKIASESQHPSKESLFKLIEELKYLMRQWEHRVLDSEKAKIIFEYLLSMEQYLDDVDNNTSRRIFLKDCGFLIELFLRDIISIKTRLRYEDLD
jgi:hypothetical protein